MEEKTAKKKLRELHETFSGNITDPEFFNKIKTLAENTVWRPDIVGAYKRFIASAINFTISGKSGKRMCINNYLKSGEVPNFQRCREKLTNLGLLQELSHE